MAARKKKSVLEFGDFQTPDGLASEAVELIYKLGYRPKHIIEPTCGTGSFLVASCKMFPDAVSFLGVDINNRYLESVRDKILELDASKRIELKEGDFFKFDWPSIIESYKEPLLIIGNPPWVTSSELGLLNSKNLPKKSNFHKRKGIEAITGSSNFDISEWMLLQHLKWLHGRHGFMAMLCKLSVARKVLNYAWKNNYPLKSARIHMIDSSRHFGVSVDACLFIIESKVGASSCVCDVFESIDAQKASYVIGFYENLLIANINKYIHRRNLLGAGGCYIWRSGIKHDAAKVMELIVANNDLRNGYGERVEIEDEHLFPMFKSSDVANGRIVHRRYMLVTQRYINETTSRIRETAPHTWKYLSKHAEILNKRASSIYRNRPLYSIFGVGEYSFAPWKIAISGFYKNLKFVKYGPINGRPVIFDDTVNYLPCKSEEEANLIEMMLNSEPAKEFYESMIFWSDKRPVTIKLLKLLNLRKLSIELGLEKEYDRFSNSHMGNSPKSYENLELPLFV